MMRSAKVMINFNLHKLFPAKTTHAHKLNPGERLPPPGKRYVRRATRFPNLIGFCSMVSKRKDA